jgi:hypothetical protein
VTLTSKTLLKYICTENKLMEFKKGDSVRSKTVIDKKLQIKKIPLTT